MIASAKWDNAAQTSVQVTMSDGSSMTVPSDPANMDWIALSEWVNTGNSISPYVAPVVAKQIDFLSFMNLFSAAEQDAIVNSADTKVKLFLLMATGAGAITMSDPRIKQSLDYLVSINLLTAAREAVILAS